MERIRETNSNDDLDQEENEPQIRSGKEELTGEIPSAPELKTIDFNYNLDNAVEDSNLRIPERIERPQSSIWTKLRKKFSKYKLMKADEETVDPNSINPISVNQINSNSSAPDPVFGNLENRNNFLRKLYTIFIGQLSFFNGLCALFYYVPHIRKIFRKTFADKIFLKTVIGIGPLGLILIGLFFFESIRRKHPNLLFISLTGCLSCLLCYFMSYESANLSLLMEISLSNGCFIFAKLLNLIFPKFSLRNRLESIFFPSFMVAGQGLQPLLLKKHFSQTWYTNLIFVGGVSYLGFNLSSILNNKLLKLKSNEFFFGAMQTYVNVDPLKLISRPFNSFGPHRSNFQAI